MHQIVMNLGANAVQAIGAAEGIVHIHVERAELDQGPSSAFICRGRRKRRRRH